MIAGQLGHPPSAQPPALLLLAKSPVAGRAKTRLSPPASPAEAARLAAASLLDTLEAMCSVSAAVPLVAWTGELAGAERRAELEDALRRVSRFAQRVGTLGQRIVAAHREVARRLPGSPVLQIGMDTPQLSAADLTAALRPLSEEGGPDAVFGPACDGGWWGLGLRDPNAAAAIEAVSTSRADTGELTLRALRAAGLTVRVLDVLRDVDTADDALAVAASGAGHRFNDAVDSVLRPRAGSPR
jgi:glycosyltransferase A (GT-A) superfamily protein (DUF2064 family)